MKDYRPPIPKNRYGYYVADFNYMYRYYRQHPDVDRDTLPSQATMRKFFMAVAKKIWEKIIKDTWVCKLPEGFGQILVYEQMNRGKPQKYTRYIDWPATMEKGKHVFKYNLHSNGIKHKLKWDKTLCSFKRSQFYYLHFYKGESDDIIGQKGITYWVRKCSEDPHLRDYRSNILE